VNIRRPNHDAVPPDKRLDGLILPEFFRQGNFPDRGDVPSRYISIVDKFISPGAEYNIRHHSPSTIKRLSPKASVSNFKNLAKIFSKSHLYKVDLGEYVKYLPARLRSIVNG
jgi:hypothetical protein